MSVQWYLLKTWIGREEEAVSEICRSVPNDLYKECFVIYQERIWRKQQRSTVQLKPAFPGCAFLTCPAGKISWQRLERIPAISRMIAFGGLSIFPMMEEDAHFLEKISGEEHIIRLSYVLKDEEGNIRRLSGPLKDFLGQVDRIQLKKRYAMARHRLWGEEKIFVLGIALKEDMEQKVPIKKDVMKEDTKQKIPAKKDAGEKNEKNENVQEQRILTRREQGILTEEMA